MSDFIRVLLGIHAEARRIDRDQALLGALGVGAFAYPHQIDSVHRMVTGPTCRWLLADEVGLGKTIQAIMVMRALAAQSSSLLNVALVVPDDLAGQWEEELLCRGHAVAIEAGESAPPRGNLVMRLVRPSRITSGGRLAADKIDLLLVDEFTRLQVSVRDELIAAARTIPNVIAMTATPALHLGRTRRELMALLEPEAARVAQAQGGDILKVLAEREETALERHGSEMKDAVRRRQIEDTYGVYRRLIRTQRTDYPDALPQRRYQPIRVAPTDGDVERAIATRGYLEAAKVGDPGLRRDVLLQVAGRSSNSLRERLSTLKRGDGLQDAWRAIDVVLRKELGDARLDALVDHVRDVLAKKPDARMIVVAEDNPTTDYLHDALTRLTDVKVARKRRTVSAAEELEVQVALLKDALDDFVNGDAKILVAAVDAREGHNLQFADEIIFFALPWSPPDIQQWIGRIDRLGTRGVPSKRRIRITPIVVENSIESRILEVLEGTNVFQKSEVFDDAEWSTISNAITAAADGVGGASWGEAVRQAKTLGSMYDEWLDATKLRPTPRTALALRCEARFHTRAYAAPFDPTEEGQRTNWFHARECAADLMLRIAREDFLDIRKGRDGDQRFRTVWYKPAASGIEIHIPDIDNRSSAHRQAFISHRAAIDCPPRTNVVQKDDRKRQLHFFDHGCGLHDGMLAAFVGIAPQVDLGTEFSVAYPEGHPILAWRDRRLLVAISGLDRRRSMPLDVDAVLGSLGPEASVPEQDARARTARLMRADHDADVRWLVDLAPPEMFLAVLVEDGEDVVPCDAAAMVFDPVHDDRIARQLARRRSTLSDARLRAARSAAQRELARLGSDSLGRAAVALRAASPTRLFAIQVEAENLAAAAQAELRSAERLDSKLEFNRAAVRAAELTVSLLEASAKERRRRVSDAAAAFELNAELTPQRYFWLVPRLVTEDLA